MNEHIPNFPPEIIERAEKSIRDILSLAIQHSDSHSALIVSDSQCDLAIALTGVYRRCLPKAKFIDFDKTSREEILKEFDALKPLDLVVLIQSSSFRLGEFRIRVELFNRSLKVIEHPHLGRMPGDEPLYYLDSLAYDPKYYRALGSALKNCIDRAKVCVVESGGEKLVFESGFEPAKLNIGDYTGMKNIGGQFPIGEVFTEARDLEALNGRVRVFGFGNTDFLLTKPEKPITLEVVRGRVTKVYDTTPEFEKVLASIRGDEGEVWMRELGFGLNRAFTRERTVSDIGTYERMCGIHLSLGAKHGLYKKPNIKKSEAKYHVDIFAATETVTLDEKIVYQNGSWQLSY